MIYEFRELLPEGVKVSDEEYNDIETVYMWYPTGISKKGIAELYVNFGMTLIKDMLPRALVNKDLNQRKTKALQKAASYGTAIQFIEEGHDPEELPDNIKQELHIE